MPTNHEFHPSNNDHWLHDLAAATADGLARLPALSAALAPLKIVNERALDHRQ